MSRTSQRKRKKAKNLIVIILLLILVIVGSIIIISGLDRGKDNPDIDNPNADPVIDEPAKFTSEVNINFDSGELDSEATKLVTDFFRTYYGALSNLEKVDISKYYLPDATKQIKLYQTALDYLVEVRLMQETDLRITNTRAELKVTKLSVEDGLISLTVNEDCYVKFKELNGLETEILGVENIFRIDTTTGEYKLKAYRKVQGFFILFREFYNDDIEKLEPLKAGYLEKMQALVDQRVKDKENYEKYLAGLSLDPKESRITVKEADNEYDRVAAQAYAKEYVGKRNKKYAEFPGNNCQNFASQVLRAGGIPNDTENTGEYTTWYNNGGNDYNYVWTYVPYFRVYARDNKGSGLVSAIDQNIYTALPGDIFEVGTTGGPTRHTTVVADILTDKDGNFIDALLSSNTLDMKNFPVTAYVYPYQSLVKVYGYND